MRIYSKTSCSLTCNVLLSVSGCVRNTLLGKGTCVAFRRGETASAAFGAGLRGAGEKNGTATERVGGFVSLKEVVLQPML